MRVFDWVVVGILLLGIAFWLIAWDKMAYEQELEDYARIERSLKNES